ncbi:MAG: ABC transporter ATP-binding protein [Conexivisphaerales archaeon]
MSDLAIRMTGMRKSFPGVLAVDDVDFEVRKGEIRGLLGENGAGKSTLMRLLYGLYRLDAGRIEVDGKEAHIGSSHDAIRLGIGMVHQEFMLVPNLSVKENIVLGFEPGSSGVFSPGESRQRVLDLSKSSGLPVDPDVVVERLPTGLKQRVEILKALYRGAKTLILDEPTAVLTPVEVVELFKSIRKMRDSGTTIIFITHKLQEIKEITDSITVMRRGRVVGGGPTKDVSIGQLANMMVGREVIRSFSFNPYSPGEVLLEVKGLRVAGRRKAVAVDGVSFAVRKGEIVGLAGVDGNGQSELVESLIGFRKPLSGTISVKGVVTTSLDTSKILEKSVGHIPEDRLAQGLVMDFSISDNSVLGIVQKDEFSSRSGLIYVDKVRRFAENVVHAFGIVTNSVSMPAKNLSGGNQQKLIAGRELSRDPDLLIAAQPTRGLDISATEYIQSLLVKSRNSGKGILLVSADFDEVLNLSDRILIIFEGKIIGELSREQANVEALGRLLGGVSA